MCAGRQQARNGTSTNIRALGQDQFDSGDWPHSPSRRISGPHSVTDAKGHRKVEGDRPASRSTQQTARHKSRPGSGELQRTPQ